jgi:hypothetical protein
MAKRDDAQGAAPAPSFLVFTVESAEIGELVTLRGRGFFGISSVAFDGIEAEFSVVSGETLLATIPVGAADGLCVVTGQYGSGTIQLSLGDSMPQTVIGNAAIDAGALIKVSTVEGRYVTLGSADLALLMAGVAITACAGSGSSFSGQFVPGTVTSMLSDGTGTIPIGSPVEPSTTVAGRVKAGSTNLIGYNVGALVAATLNAAVSVR